MKICHTITHLKKTSSRTHNAGQALAELIFALAMAIFLLSGLIVAVRAGLENTSYSQHKITSTHLAQDSIELVRAFRDEEGYDYITDSNKDDFGYLDSDHALNLNGGTYQRDISIVENTPDVKLVTVTVSWDEQNKPIETVLKTIITNHD